MESVAASKLDQDEIQQRFQILQYKVKELEIEKIWNHFEKAGFEPLLIKGWAASKLYPEPFRRHFTDVDLVISPEKYADAIEFAKEVRERIPVDLHAGARHLDSLSFENLLANSVIEKCGETEIRVLRPEDHLRVLCVHWLTDGGAYRDKLWDIYYGVDNRTENFDWDRFLNTVTARRRRWLICTIGLAHKYLGLDIAQTPISDEAKELPKWLTTAVEREWASDIKMQPLSIFRNDKKMLWKQIKKRIPPNPVHATVMEEGEFDGGFRIIYQIKNIFRRLKPYFPKNQ